MRRPSPKICVGAPPARRYLGAGGERSGEGAAGVHLVAEHRRPADQLAFEEERHADQKVVDVGDGAAALVGVRGQDHVAGLDHFVVLLADDRAHGGAEEHRVHLVAGVAQRALDDVEGHRVDVDVGDLGDLDSTHCSMPQPSG